MRRTVSLSVLVACLMMLASVLDTYSTFRSLSVAESSIGDLVRANWKAIFFPLAVGVVSLVRTYILLSSSRRPYYQMVFSGLLVFLISIGHIWANWPQPDPPADCPPVPIEGKICFAIYSIPAWYWSNPATMSYLIVAPVRSLITSAWAAMKYRYK